MKRKITQDELRRLMGDQKKKFTVGTRRIESPLARYNGAGQLTCVVCESIVRSEAVWSIHLNSKNHRENISKKAKRKESPTAIIEPIPPKKLILPPLPDPSLKPTKSILKNSRNPTPVLPSNFFESGTDLSSQEIQPNLMKNSTETENSAKLEEYEEDLAEGEQLPEGFFDDPKLDAKVRNVEYKDPVEEEWEQFQKAIKEETSKAQQIISEDQEEATTERQIDEIDEQLRHWSRVVSLEKKKKEAVTLSLPLQSVKLEGSQDVVDEEQFEEFVDWRSKRSFI